MAKNEEHGFDLVATRERLEDWWLENVSVPVGCGLSYWPGGRSDSILALVFGHWLEHGVHMPTVSAPRCFDARCPVLGVARGLLEMRAYQVTSLERRQIVWLKHAERISSISDSMRAALLTRAEHLATARVSRAVENETNGRPKRMLAQAVAQHLRAGGFAYSKVAAFMGAATVGVTSKRCKVRGVRSLSAVVGPPSSDDYCGPSDSTEWRVAKLGHMGADGNRCEGAG